MNSRDDSNRINIILQGFIDEEEAEDDISDADEYNSIVLKSAEMKLLEEEIFQVAKQARRILCFQEICGVTSMLEFEVRNDEVMNEKPEEGPRKMHLYILEVYMEGYWHKDYDVLFQEHNQLQGNSIQHMRSEVDKELVELWKLIQQHSNKTNTGQTKKGILAKKDSTSEGNGKL